MYEPVDALQSPRYSGPRTFGRLPHVETTDGVDVALFGIPWDSGTSYRPGPRFGPEAVRSASALLRPYNPAQDVMVWGALSCVDYGDAPTVPGYIEDTLARVQAYVEVIHRGGAIPLGIGGDHSVTLAELRAAAALHGPLGLVHLDAHHDVWDSYFGRPYNHGTVFKRACEEGLLDPARCVQAGMRGSLYGPEDYQVSRDLGMTILPWLELRELGPEAYGELLRERLGAGPGVLHVRRRLRGSGLLPGHGNAGGGGPDLGRGAGLRACAARPRLPRLRRGGGRAAVRRARSDHRAARGQRGLRDALAGRALRA